MELTKEFIENSLDKAMQIFKDAEICKVDNEVKVEFLDGDKFIESAKEDMFNQLLIQHGFIKNFEKEYPGFLVVYARNKDPFRNIFGLPYYISIDFNRAKRLLMPYSKSKVEKYFISVFLHEITHIFENDIIENNKDFYNELLVDNNNIPEAANEILAEIVSYKYGYTDITDKIVKDLYKDIYNKMFKAGFNPNQAQRDFKSKADKFNLKA